MACGCTHHPGLTHEEHMDRFDREKNEENIKRGIQQLRTASNFIEAVSARVLINAGAKAEVKRLNEKERLMRSGRIRS